MEVILLKDVENLGGAGDVVAVKAGYGRNYLIPQKLAVTANSTNRRVAEERIRQEAIRNQRMLAEFQAIAEKLKEVVIRVGAKAGTSGKIFGSVTNIQLANAVKEQANIEIDRRKVTLNEEVKTLGSYTASVDLHSEVPCTINFEVFAD